MASPSAGIFIAPSTSTITTATTTISVMASRSGCVRALG
jgi:hypothetical protein